MLHWFTANDGAHAGYIFIGLVALFVVGTLVYWFILHPNKKPTASK